MPASWHLKHPPLSLPNLQEVLPLFPLDWEKIRGRRRYGATGTRNDLAPKASAGLAALGGWLAGA